jgi:hypothetical protein
LCLADLKGWGELFQIAAPDYLSYAAKQEINMSDVITTKPPIDAFASYVLAQTDCYIETLSIETIDAQPGLLELVIRTQLLSAKNPAEKRVKSRTCIERSRLIELHQGIGQFLQATVGSSFEPVLS